MSNRKTAFIPRNSNSDSKFPLPRSANIHHSSTMTLGSGHSSPSFNTANTAPQFKDLNNSVSRQTTSQHKSMEKETPSPITCERVLELLLKERRKLYDYGYLHSLGCTYWSTDQEVDSNFNCLAKQYIKLIDEGEKQYTLDLKRIIGGHQLLRDEGRKKDYLHILKMRSILTQPLTLQALQTSSQELEPVYPYFLFPIQIKGCRDLTKDRIMEINFIDFVVSESFKDHAKTGVHFGALKRVVASHKEDQFLMQIEQHAPMQLIATIADQRDLIVRLLRLAMEKYYQTFVEPVNVNSPNSYYFKPKKEKKNKKKRKDRSPGRRNQNEDEVKNQEENEEEKIEDAEENKEMDLSVTAYALQLTEALTGLGSNSLYPRPPGSGGLRLIEDDYVLPQKSLKKGIVNKRCTTRSFDTPRFLLLGCSQLLITKDLEGLSICGIIPLYNSKAIGNDFGSKGKASIPPAFVRAYRPKPENLKIETHFKDYEMIFESEEEAEEWEDEINDILSGEIVRKPYEELLEVRNALDEVPLTKQEELDLIENQIAQMRARLEMLSIRKGELKAELRDLPIFKDYQHLFDQNKNDDDFYEIGENGTSGGPSRSSLDGGKRYGFDLLSPKEAQLMRKGESQRTLESEKDVVLRENKYGEQLVIKRDTIRQIRKSLVAQGRVADKKSS